MQREGHVGQGLVGARAWILTHDEKLARLRVELEEVEGELKTAEQRVPENVRDLDTLELHLQGETKGNLREMMDQFLGSYQGLKAYADLLERKWSLERQIDERKQVFGITLPN